MKNPAFLHRACGSLLVFVLAATATTGDPVWWFGAAAGANANFYGGTIQRLNSTTTSPVPFHDGFGLGPYGALAVEYRPQGLWGAGLQIGYDARGGAWEKVVCPCGEEASLFARPAYLTLEPSLIWAPFGGRFHVFAGPRAGLLAPFGNTRGWRVEREGAADTRGDFGEMRRVVFSAQAGAGYDFDVAASGNLRWRVAPFASWHPWGGESPRSTDGDVESWRLSTVRVGVVLKWGHSDLRAPPAIRFSARPPARVVSRRTIYETFPLRDYVFFDTSATEIAQRYARLTPNEAAGFREEQLQDTMPSELKGRSRRQMAVYRNLLNILGDRLRRNPAATITLTGVAAQGQESALARAESVKRYLVAVFGLAPDRIATGTKAPPTPPLGRPREDLERLEAEAKRVEIGSRSPEMLVQVGEGFMLKPVRIEGPQEPSDSVFFRVEGAERLATWRLEITDETGRVAGFGPFDEASAPEGRVSVSASKLLGERDQGSYRATVVADPAGGAPGPLRRQTAFMLSRRNHGIEETRRFAILFDIDQARAVSAYETFLAGTVAERITDTSVVVVRGRTDVVGDADYNRTLSRNRAQGVESLLREAASRAGRNGVVFKSSWSGEEESQAPFGNATPEERCYNRTVIIDLLPE